VDTNTNRKNPLCSTGSLKVRQGSPHDKYHQEQGGLNQRNRRCSRGLANLLRQLSTQSKVGIAAILILNGRHTLTLQFHLGSDKEHTVHEAKLVGLLLSLHMLSSREYRGMSAMVGIDN
jgi:hypothetical protein